VALLSRDFFARYAVEVAPGLLGCVLEHQTAAGLVAVELTEVEAYAGQSDPASHAYHGKTKRNAAMFGPPGHAYVYFTYGMHFCVNLVCLGEEGSVSAILLRAGAIIEGEDLARARRSVPKPGTERACVPSRDLARGPARLCQALSIDRSLDGADVCVPDSPLRVRPPQPGPPQGQSPQGQSPQGQSPQGQSPQGQSPQGQSPQGQSQGTGASTTARSGKILSGPRVGVSAAAEVPWRFWFEGEPTVSLYRAHVPRRRKLVTP
jgi:DNA-3-methyladenine glycosylase